MRTLCKLMVALLAAAPALGVGLAAALASGCASQESVAWNEQRIPVEGRYPGQRSG